MRKSVIARLVIFTDSAAPSMKRSDVSPPAEFSKSAKQARLFSHTAAPPAELRWSLPLRSITPLIMFKSGVTRRPYTRRYGGSATPPAHYTRRMELLRYFVISLTLSGDSFRPNCRDHPRRRILLAMSPAGWISHFASTTSIERKISSYFSRLVVSHLNSFTLLKFSE